MKVVMRVLLALAIVLLAYISWKSIQGPIDFNAEVEKRDRAVIQRLVDIRTAQVAYRATVGVAVGVAVCVAVQMIMAVVVTHQGPSRFH